MYDLNKPYEGDLCKYNGEWWVFVQNRWMLLMEANKIVWEMAVLNDS